MRRVLIKGIPYWTDGELTLPEIAGGQMSNEDRRFFQSILNDDPPENVNVPAAVVRPLSDFVNRVMLDVDTGTAGILTHRVDRRGDIYTLYNPQTRKSYNIRRGRTLFDPTTRALTSIGNSFQNTRTTTASQADINRLGLSTGGAGGGSGGGVSADTAASVGARHAEISSQERIAAANRTHEIELDRLRTAREAEQERARAAREAELERIREENALKRAKLGEAGALARTAAEVKQRAGQWLSETVGTDPFRAGVGGQGGLQRGATPAEYYRGQWQGIASQPIPQVDENSALPEIQKGIDTLQGMQQQPIMPTFGFAEGGQLSTQQGDGSGQGGVTGQAGSTKRGVLTGERNMDGDEEVVVMDAANPGVVEVIPLVSHAAQGGTFDTSVLSPIYGSMGFGSVPHVARDVGNSLRVGATPTREGTLHGSQVFGRLGYQPRLIRDSGKGSIFFRNPRGQLQPIASQDVFNRAGFRMEDVLNVESPQVPEFGSWGPDLTEPPPTVEQGAGIRPRSIPLITPPEYGSVLLPDPTALAGIWKFLDPQTQIAVASAYGASGLGGGGGSPVTNALEQIKMAIRTRTPVGTSTRAGSARLG